MFFSSINKMCICHKMKKAKRDHPFPSRTAFHLNRFVNQKAEHCIKKNLNLRIKTEPVAVAVETDATVYVWFRDQMYSTSFSI